MAKLVRKIMVLVVAVATMLVLLIAAPFPRNDYFGLYKIKHRDIENITSNKIIFVGGSGVFYSISAEIIEKRIHNYHAYNMGLNAGLGLQFNLDEIKPYLKAGDIVVLIPEHGNFDGAFGGSVLTLLALDSVPELLQHTSYERMLYLLWNFGLTFIPIKCQYYLNDIVLYTTNTSPMMNKNGDIKTHTAVKDVANMDFVLKVNYSSSKYKACINILNDFSRYCTEKNIDVILSFPAIPAPQYLKARQNLKLLYENISINTTIPVLYGPEHSVYPVEMFDDTIYHLNSQGKILNSSRILNRLKEVFPRVVDTNTSFVNY